MTRRSLPNVAISCVLWVLGACTSQSKDARYSHSLPPTIDSNPTTEDTGGDSARGDSGGQSDSRADSGADTGTVVAPGPWVALSCEDVDCAAIADDGRIVEWGDDSQGQLELVPDGTFTAVSVSFPGACALDEAGAITCWPTIPIYPPPSGAFREVRANSEGLGCALGFDDGLQCWGAFGQTLPTYAAPPTAQPFAHLSGGRAVQGALTFDGTPTCWGDAGYFIAADGVPLTPTDSGYTAMTCGDNHCCAPDAAGMPTCWGGTYANTADPGSLGPFSSLSAGDEETCGVEPGGRQADCWPGDPDASFAAPTGDPWVAFEFGDSFACGLTVNHNISCFGTIGAPPDPP